ncbi:MAG: phospholipase A2 [Solirubrobacteraceae bacterium MAG38_C4-C5]|nr:phospholipase A2 [Candidatus Siliceabacter maunaloa]
MSECVGEAVAEDVLGRLTDAVITSTNTDQTLERFEYAYDKASNRTLQVHDDQRTDYTYNTNNELTRSDASLLEGSTTYDYDPAGNLTASSAGFEADYNAQGQTTRMQGPQSLVDQVLGTDREATFAYAGSDQTERVQKNSTLFTNSPFGLASEATAGEADYYTRDNQGRLVSVRTPEGSHYYLTDNIGSVVALTGPGPDADVTASYRYEPFGQNQDTTGELIQPYRFAGEYLDSQTGHYKIGARYYNPQLARWTQQDPIPGYDDPKRINRYPYANSDPVNTVDPSGLHGQGTNGCTGVPDYPSGFNFHRSCDGHDSCYAAQRGRSYCDVGFGQDLLKTCTGYIRFPSCSQTATTYYLGVRALGAPAYYLGPLF